MNKELYLVYIGTGEYSDYHESLIFGTYNKDKAEKWIKRYNKILKERKNFIHEKYEDVFNDKRKKDYFWEHFILYENPQAILRTLKDIR